jgi:hypothetical protein
VRRFVLNMTSPVAIMIVPAAPHRKYSSRIAVPP